MEYKEFNIEIICIYNREFFNLMNHQANALKKTLGIPILPN